MGVATLVGYHGRRNLGDDLFLRIGCGFLGQNGIKKVYVAGDFRYVPSSIDSVSLHGFERRHWFARFVWLQIFFYALRSDVVLFCAGSIFTIQPFFLAATMLRLARLLNPKLKVLAIGVSIGPIRSSFDGFWCARMLEQIDEVVLRDNESENVLIDIGAKAKFTSGCDLALTWAGADYRKNQEFVIGISLNRNVVGANGGMDDTILQSISDLSKEERAVFIKILTVCADEFDGDVSVGEALLDRLRMSGLQAKLCVYTGFDLDGYLQEIATCSCVITSRMHTGILAMMSSVPVFQVVYAVKIKAFFERSGVASDFLFDPQEVNSDLVLSFLRKVSSGLLNDVSQMNRKKLLQEGDKMRAILDRLSHSLS